MLKTIGFLTPLVALLCLTSCADTPNTTDLSDMKLKLGKSECHSRAHDTEDRVEADRSAGSQRTYDFDPCWDAEQWTWHRNDPEGKPVALAKLGPELVLERQKDGRITAQLAGYMLYQKQSPGVSEQVHVELLDGKKRVVCRAEFGATTTKVPIDFPQKQSGQLPTITMPDSCGADLWNHYAGVRLRLDSHSDQ